MTLVSVVVKHSRKTHTFKYSGGVLNPKVRYYVRRVTSKALPLERLEEIKGELYEQAASH